MAKGNKIVISDEPRGRFVEGTIATGDTPKPGTIMQIDVSEGIDANGRFTWEEYNADADGGRPKGPLIVLTENWGLGKRATDAYAAGDHAFGYIPLPGDELNMLLQDVSGTADTYALGDMLIIDDTTGKLIETTGSPECEPFMLVEEVTTVDADVLAHCIFTGY